MTPTYITPERSAPVGFAKGVLRGLTAMASLFNRNAKHPWQNQKDDENWNHWLFLRLNGYEVHISGPGVPVEPKHLEPWIPLLDDISTLIFRPCAASGDPSNQASNVEPFSQELVSVVKKIGPVLASDEFSLISDDNKSVSSIMELHTKIFVSEKIIKNFDVAEKLFRRALLVEPRNADLLGDFALFMQDVRSDHDQAEELYRRALAEAPDHEKNLSNFAVFLHEVRRDYDQAERFYRLALDVSPDKADTLGNYALFLHEIREDDDLAEDYYRRAWHLDPNDSTILSNYALFLYNTRRDDDFAEKLFRRALANEDHDANCLGNFALFMKNVRHDYDAAEALFSRALQMDPNHAAHLGNFALFMKNIRRNYDKAEALYHRALQADPNDSNNLGNFAIFMKHLRHDTDVAEDLYRRSLQMEPSNASRLSGFVQLLLSQGRTKEGLPLLDKAIALQAPNPSLNLILWYFVLAHDANRFTEAMHQIKGFIKEGVRSLGTNLQSNHQRARLEGHQEPEFLEILAKVIAGEEEVQSLDRFACWVATPPHNEPTKVSQADSSSSDSPHH
ncbi:MAG: tetratricopeptide repeat protein [Magnetococcus sp. YQC-5]